MFPRYQKHPRGRGEAHISFFFTLDRIPFRSTIRLFKRRNNMDEEDIAAEGEDAEDGYEGGWEFDM